MSSKEGIHIGIPRREPCGKCGLPVFIAERLNVGKQLYHRTCFRCARCNSQLSLANYYETETDNQYCCETCPDEEVDSTINSNSTAFISQAISDEEKTNHLQAEDDYSAHFETALESQIDSDDISHSEFREARSEFLKDLLEDSATSLSPNFQKEEITLQKYVDVIDDNPPSSPTKSSLNSLSLKEEGDKSAIINYSSIHDLEDKPKPSPLPRTKFPKLQDLENKPPDLPNMNNSLVNNLEEEAKPPELPTTKYPSFSNRNVENHSRELPITKYASLSSLSASVVNESGFHSNPESLSHSVNKSVSDKELIKDNLADNSITKENVHKNSSLVKARMRLFETNIPSSSVDTNASKTDESLLTNLDTNDILTNSNECNISTQDTILISNENSIISISDDSKISIEPIEEVANSINNKSDDSILSSEHDSKKEYPGDLNPFGDDEEDKYNKNLNPFGDDDDDDDLSEKNLNPFEEDDVKEVGGKLRKISICPEDWTFSTNKDDTPEHLKSVVTKRTRLTAFELSGESYNHLLDNEGYNKKMETYHEVFFGSTSSISSEATSTPSIRKKKVAPKPPIPNFSLSPQCSQASSPSNSLHPSPSPRMRKSRKAPPPPVDRKNIIENPKPDNDLHKSVTSINTINEYNSEKQIKDEVNLKRRSQSNFDNDDTIEDHSKIFNSSVPNKSTYGKWKRKKGRAPPRPIAQKRSIKPVSFVEIKGELDLIEIQQQGLEKQGVRLEKMIREQSEGSNSETAVSIEADDLILQLFEVVNEKNELFRRQAELMYIQRQHALEEEQAEVEYQIRCLMLQPELNKTDSDKAKEEELISSLVTIVERRNEIVECLERERVRDFEEDESISSSLNLYATKRDEACLLEKKELSQKKSKRFKIKTLYRKSKTDIDKDIDESELSVSKSSSKEKKHKKFTLF